MHKQLVPVPNRLTYDDNAALPDDRNRYEIIDGDWHVSPAPTTNRQRTLMRLSDNLQHHVNQSRLGEVLSTSKPQLDLRNKRQAFARCGVPWYWIVDSWNRRVLELQWVGSAYAEVVELGDGDTFTPQRFPGLSMRVADLWRQQI